MTTTGAVVFAPSRILAGLCVIALVSNAYAQTTDASTTIVSGPLGKRADSALTAISGQGFSGVVLVAKDGQIVLRKGYGLANRATNTPMTPATVVQIGSNTKDFTTVAILQLMERGKLALSDSIAKYFRNVPEDKRGIKIDHLLRHRAGFDQHLGGDFEAVSRDDEIARAMSGKLLFPPGADRKYSNIGYSLLAAIVELTTGVSYDEYVRDNILKPLGLHETGLLLPRFDPKRLAHGYRDGRDMGSFLERPLAADGPYWNLRGNGGMLSTVTDMHRFYTALMSDGPLLKPASRDLFFRPNQPMVLAGSDMTFFFFYSRDPAAGLETFLATNSTDYPAPTARAQLSTALSADVDAPVVFPSTPAATAAKNFVRVHNGGDSTAIHAFLAADVVPRAEDRRSVAERVATFKGMRERMGLLTPVRIVTSTPNEITFEARTAQDGVVTFTITVEQTAPFRIIGISAEAK
jgi:CubicO group peptidase (beta-lactamase class C family)